MRGRIPGQGNIPSEERKQRIINRLTEEGNLTLTELVLSEHIRNDRARKLLEELIQEGKVRKFRRVIEVGSVRYEICDRNKPIVVLRPGRHPSLG